MSAHNSGQTRRNFIKRGALFAPAIFIPRLIRAQSILTADGLAAFVPPASGGGGGGGGGTWSLVGSAHAQSASNTAVTTGGIDTTGANVLVLLVTYSGGTVPVPTDSYSNSWTTALTSALAGTTNPRSRWRYVLNPSVGTGHTFTVPAVSGTVCSIYVYAFAKSGGSPTYGSAVGDGTTFTSNWGSSGGIQPGSITPAGANSAFVSAVVYDVTSSSIANNGGFTIGTAIPAPVGIVTGHKLKTADSSAENPKWTSSTNADAFATMIYFY